MANIDQIKQAIIDTVLTGGSRTMALSIRTILNQIADSYANFKNGGKLFEVEVGYKDAFRPSSAGAFATVDMIGVSGPSAVTNSATKALLENNANWTNNQYIGVAITGQVAGDWYINDSHDYKFFTRLGVLTARRIYYINSTPPTTGFTYTFPLTLS